MALGAFAPGAYQVEIKNIGANGPAGSTPAGKTETASGVDRDLGLVEGVKTISRTVEGKDIRADLYGDTVIDGIYRGGQMFVSMIFKEWTVQVQDALWPFGGDSGDFGRVGTVGDLMTNLSGEMTLTAATGTPAGGVANSNIITLHSAIISPGHSYDVPLGNDERDVPIVFRCYPILVSTVLRWATFTT